MTVNSVTYVVPQLLAVSPYGVPTPDFYGAYIVAQGTGQGNRIGNRIQTKKVTLRFVATAAPTASTASYLIMWVLRDKTASTEPVIPGGNFIQNGNSSQNLTGSVFDTISFVNRDVWTLYKRRVFKIGFASYATVGSNNDFSQTRVVTMDLTKYVAKTVQFNDFASDPTSPITYIAFEAVSADGSNLTQAPVIVQTWLDYQFIDV